MVTIRYRNRVLHLIIFLGVTLIIKSPMTAGKIFGGALALLFVAAATYLYIKIAKSNNS